MNGAAASSAEASFETLSHGKMVALKATQIISQ